MDCQKMTEQLWPETDLVAQGGTNGHWASRCGFTGTVPGAIRLVPTR